MDTKCFGKNRWARSFVFLILRRQFSESGRVNHINRYTYCFYSSFPKSFMLIIVLACVTKKGYVKFKFYQVRLLSYFCNFCLRKNYAYKNSDVFNGSQLPIFFQLCGVPAVGIPQKVKKFTLRPILFLTDWCSSSKKFQLTLKNVYNFFGVR